MIQNISLSPGQVKRCTYVTLKADGMLNGFPLLSIDRDSYIVGLAIQSGIDFDPAAGRHCIAIGKCCSLAESITFMLDLNHDYASVCQGELSCLKGLPAQHRAVRKGSVILQNDVWVGHGATVMAGVTLHNGCVVAADAVVTKDVPPYAIVGGNPARILRYRFDEDTVAGLQKIAWWDWPEQVQNARREDFLLPAEEFVEKYLPEAESRLDQAQPPPVLTGGDVLLFIPDIEDAFPLYPRIFAQYFQKDRPDTELFIYLPKRLSKPEHIQKLTRILEDYEACDAYVTLQTGMDLDERMLFRYADSYITTRSRETVGRTCLADLCETKLLYGTDDPLFRT